MATDPASKSTLEEIRSRFDNDVERFSNLDTAQQTIPDASLMLELCCSAAAAITPGAKSVLDLGCGAGNFTLKLLQKLPGLDCRLVDLSQPMLDRASARVSAATTGKVNSLQTDLLSLQLPGESVDIILAGAVVDHLRGEEDWTSMFRQMHAWLKPGGSLWISDMVSAATAPVQLMFRERYERFLDELGGKDYRRKVLDYVDREDSPRSVSFQWEKLKVAGFREVELLHKNGDFAAFGAVK